MSLKGAEILETASKYWPYPRGYYVVLFILLVLVELPILVSTKSSLILSFLLFIITGGFLYIIWRFTRSIPKTKKKKVGFVISITCDDEDEAKKIRQDFIFTLQRLIKEGKTGTTFQFIEAPSYISETIVDIEDAQKLRIHARAHFLLFGRVRVRELDKKMHHYIELDGVVAHKPIPEDISNEISKEFAELLPRKVAIPTENDLLAFQFASEWAEVVAKYIIGIAAAVSGDLPYAEQLFENALSKAQKSEHEFPVFEKLRERLPLRLFEIYEARARNSYEKWVATKDQHEIENIGSMIAKIDFSRYKNISIMHLKSIYHFLTDRNVTMAKECLNEIGKKNRNSAWHLNMAFLDAYETDLKSSIRHYRRAITMPVQFELIYKVEDFIYYIATLENDKYQLYYCLGFYNWKIKGDYLQAIKDLETFLESGNAEEYPTERELAKNWLKELYKNIH